MLKFCLNFLLIFLMLTPISFAKKDMEAHLKQEYGNDLRSVPYFLKFDFYKKFHYDWKDTYYYQRHGFLEAYEISSAADQAKEKSEAKALALKNKEKDLALKKERLKEKQRLKDRLEKEKAEVAAENANQKEFDDTIKSQQQEIKDMKRDLQDLIEADRQASMNNR